MLTIRTATASIATTTISTTHSTSISHSHVSTLVLTVGTFASPPLQRRLLRRPLCLPEARPVFCCPRAHAASWPSFRFQVAFDLRALGSPRSTLYFQPLRNPPPPNLRTVLHGSSGGTRADQHIASTQYHTDVPHCMYMHSLPSIAFPPQCTTTETMQSNKHLDRTTGHEQQQTTSTPP